MHKAVYHQNKKLAPARQLSQLQAEVAGKTRYTNALAANFAGFQSLAIVFYQVSCFL